MATAIEVNKKSVKELLETGKKKKFIIPEYQRPYAWTDDEIKTLFDDLIEYTENDNETNYFLGTIVSYENENGEQEIIDGQQRITSLFLLLRAIYAKLNSMTETPEVRNFKNQIESALWQQDELTAEVDFEKILIESKVMKDEGNKIFMEILTSGKTGETNDNYTLNYKLFKELIEKYATSEPELFYWFIRNILNKAILLPITADSQDTALTIFSTLNDRGLALSDSDIFKAKMYNNLKPEYKSEFIEKWKSLDEEAANTNENIQNLFYYYMFYLRALENDRKTTTPGMRKYYSRNNFEQLFKDEVLDNIEKMMTLWVVVNNRIEVEGCSWSSNIEIKQALDLLLSYPNEFWKYPVIIYYLKYSEEEDFEYIFLKFLRKLFAELSAKYIITPTINAVKGSILNLNSEIIKSSKPKFEFSRINENELRENMKTPHRNTVRMILKAITYEEQDELLPERWEIEHIFPTKWQNSYFPNNTDEEVIKTIENIGNKIPFEKKLNIIASNGYFQKKKESYNKSKVKILLKLSQNHNDWGLEEIRDRNIRIADEFILLLKSWGLNEENFLSQDDNKKGTINLTEEEQELIKKMQKKGIDFNKL
ncbi:DUF262 domain-containing HNH endonuclease family protein [Tissierella pigra]|uniref:DUF262 domain-containing protein n=1 Tax=Tissierella pigra TaxID=2607614 RepID=A0A6N7Y1B7_9FIRM|nr:DUF262 domain-containing protein [Tissierella pigra]MBU5427685.1 DUF262 domain-containing HNH endonuclease family protein [Tissierella pigra]MSU03533.1 DUF262 domain-containing protein [Tissierella pigra]